MQTKQDNVQIGGTLTGTIRVPADERDNAIIQGVDIVNEYIEGDEHVIELEPIHNAMVNQGLQRMLDLLFEDTQGALSGISHIGLSADTSAVSASTTDLDPGSAGSSIKTIDNVSRTNQTTHGDQTWTQADVSWAITKIGFLYGALSTDVVNIIGGTGGSDPYDEPFTIDLTNVTTWNLTMGIDLTATAS